MSRARGFTLVEMIVALGIGFLVILGAAKTFPGFQKFLYRGHSRQQANSESRAALSTITRLLTRGSPSTLAITYPNGTNAQINFRSSDGSAYEIGCFAGTSTLYYKETLSSGVVHGPNTLAHFVSILQLTAGFNDPALVQLKMQIQAPLDAAGTLYTIDLPPQTIRMGTG